MCRLLAYLGPPVTLRHIVTDPPFGLAHQAWSPRRQRYGNVNVDGFGVGWYADGDPEPARYRQPGPIWADASFADLARVTRTRALLAVVRSATPGTEPGVAAVTPYAWGRWLFGHNGVLEGWPASAAELAASLPPADLLGLAARCDSALAWALVVARLRDGASAAAALAGAVAALAAHGVTGRFNFALTDGRAIAATAAGDTLCYRVRDGGVTVASEPSDDAPGWTDVADGSLLTATPAGAEVSPLPLTEREHERTAIQ
ncbi:MAG TPA: ergothioneine biosynthesis protein EgtC [Streptosporangiaceae bacterium]|nr:ergothioneine biosynthesis protein EgtC [Streptosporangiaceae bacterium]